MLVAVSLLAISLSFLFFKHPLSSWHTLLRSSASQVAEHEPSDATTSREEEQPIELPRRKDNDESTQKSEIASPEGTPKVTSSDSVNPAVPTFSLAGDDSDDEDDEDNLPPPSFPALNSAQRASAPVPTFSMAPPQKPASMAPPPKPTSSLMPPPQLNPSNLRALPTSPNAMRVPTTGPLPNRGPIPNRGPPSSNGGLAPGLAPVVKTPNARGKVLLSPGHSPLDWANLQRSGENLSGVPSLLRVTPSMLKEKNGRKGKPAWSSYEGKVYNITPYLPFHPGGEGELKRVAGKDGRKLFMEVHPWVNWDNMLGECLVGIMVTEEQAMPTSSLEDMD